MNQSAVAQRRGNTTGNSGMRRVIFASSLGTVFEWYDFYLYGSLAAVIAKQFFSGLNETSAYIAALLAFAAASRCAPRRPGVRPPRRPGGPPNTPSSSPSSSWACRPSWSACCQLRQHRRGGAIILIALRMLQGLALGGEIRRRGDLCDEAA